MATQSQTEMNQTSISSAENAAIIDSLTTEFVREELLEWLRNYPDGNGYINTYNENLGEELEKKTFERLSKESSQNLKYLIQEMGPSENRESLEKELENLDHASLFKMVRVLYLTDRKNGSYFTDALNTIDFDFVAVDREVFLEHVEKLPLAKVRNVVINILDYEDILPEEDEEEDDFGPSVSDDEYNGYDYVFIRAEDQDYKVTDQQLHEFLEIYKEKRRELTNK